MWLYLFVGVELHALEYDSTCLANQLFACVTHDVGFHSSCNSVCYHFPYFFQLELFLPHPAALTKLEKAAVCGGCCHCASPGSMLG